MQQGTRTVINDLFLFSKINMSMIINMKNLMNLTYTVVRIYAIIYPCIIFKHFKSLDIRCT